MSEVPFNAEDTPAAAGDISSPGVIADTQVVDAPPMQAEATSPEVEAAHNIVFLKDVEVVATVELGSTTLPIAEVLKLRRGSVVELDRLVGQPVDLLINHTLLAKGEVIVINERFGFRIMKFVGQNGE